MLRHLYQTFVCTHELYRRATCRHSSGKGGAAQVNVTARSLHTECTCYTRSHGPLILPTQAMIQGRPQAKLLVIHRNLLCCLIVLYFPGLQRCQARCSGREDCEHITHSTGAYGESHCRLCSAFNATLASGHLAPTEALSFTKSQG